MNNTSNGVRLSNAIMFGVRFARLAVELGIEPYDLAELTALAMKRVRSWERANNTRASFEPEKRIRHQFNEKAKSLGLKPLWPALYPALVKGKREFSLAYPGDS